MLNQTVLTGNLGADPEVFYSSEGNPVASFNLAFRSSKKKTGWIRCVAFGKLAETTEKYLHRGASDIKDIGKVMGPAMARLKGKADGKLVQQIARSLLSS